MTAPNEPTDHDVLIVGGGLTGVLVAEHLAAHGVSAHVLEAGTKLDRRLPACDRGGFDRAIEPLLRVDPDDWAFRTEGLAYDWLRVRAGGGRSLLWGGWLARLDAQNLKDAKAFGAPWPFETGDLDHHYHRVGQRLGVREVPIPASYSAITEELGLDVISKLCAPGPCGCRCAVSLDWLKGARLSSNAVALRVLLDARGRARGVEVADARTREVRTIGARAVVLAASPVETTRILLSTAPGGPGGSHGLVGRGLTDHLVSSYLVVVPEPPPAPGLAGPLERAAWVPRFVNLGRKRRRDYRSGFTVEVRGPMALEPLGEAVLGPLGIAPSDAPSMSHYQVHVVGEVPPSPSRYVALDPERRDAFGRPLPVIHFAWTDQEEKMARDMDESGIAIASALATPGSRVIPFRTPLTPGGVGHESGTCAMGKDPRRSVTDMNGAVRGVPKLYVADASIMPTVLDRYPTYTMLALALNVADNIIDAAGRGEI